MKYLITGGCGFLGTNLSARVIERGEELMIFDNLSRTGSEKNLEWLQEQGELTFVRGEIQNAVEVIELIESYRPDVIFHLAGQVAMTTSIENPRLDFGVNALGTFNVLEAVRIASPQTAIIYSSTNKVYGDLASVVTEEHESRYVCPDYPEGFDESTPLEFHSPYGCSKGTADQYLLDYARLFGLNSVVFRHSSIYGSRQFSTVDQGWIGWFCQQALEQSAEPFTICGTGKQVRDVLFVDDAVNAYFAAVERIGSCRGEVFNIGGGMANSLSLLELFSLLEEEVGSQMRYERLDWRASDQRVFVADIAKAERLLGWSPQVSSREGVTRMLHWLGGVLQA